MKFNFSIIALSVILFSSSFPLYDVYATDGSSITEEAASEYDTTNGTYPSTVQVDSDTYALAYTGDGNDGYISTFTISADGTTLTKVATLEHDTTNALTNSLVQVDSDTYALAYGGDGDDGFIVTFTISSGSGGTGESEPTESSCYDCIPPKLQETQIQISSNEKIITTGDDSLHITANVGDKITILLNVTDNKPVDTFRFAGLYTNYQDKPHDMNLFYANNYDNLKQVSTSFYEWNVRADDVQYDYDATLSWSETTPEIITNDVNPDNFEFKNDDGIVQYFMIPFTFTINDHVDSTQIIAKVYDGAYNRLLVVLPVVLDVSGNDPLNFENKANHKLLSSHNESVLVQTLSDWNESGQDIEQLTDILGISDESLPEWSTDLATWVAEDKIDSANLIVAVEYLINQ